MAENPPTIYNQNKSPSTSSNSLTWIEANGQEFCGGLGTMAGIEICPLSTYLTIALKAPDLLMTCPQNLYHSLC
jgi:hypothetical protein